MKVSFVVLLIILKIQKISWGPGSCRDIFHRGECISKRTGLMRTHLLCAQFPCPGSWVSFQIHIHKKVVHTAKQAQKTSSPTQRNFHSSGIELRGFCCCCFLFCVFVRLFLDLFVYYMCSVLFGCLAALQKSADLTIGGCKYHVVAWNWAQNIWKTSQCS